VTVPWISDSRNLRNDHCHHAGDDHRSRGNHPAHRPYSASTDSSDQGSTPHGYTLSLLLFIVPILVIAGWLLPSEELHIPRRAFRWTLVVLVPLGFLLDFVFARWFFRYSNLGATVGPAPALGHPVPVEEYIFYLTGSLMDLFLLCVAGRVLADSLQRTRLCG
jgi:hypothetical protein